MFIYFIGIFVKLKYILKFFFFVFIDKFIDSCFEC